MAAFFIDLYLILNNIWNTIKLNIFCVTSCVNT